MDSTALRAALSNFATGVTVITANDEHANPCGVTVNSFTSVSLDPPLCQWCLGDNTHKLDAFLGAQIFVVNILSAQQQAVSDVFATPGEFDRFSSVSFHRGRANVAVLDQCLANFECKREQLVRVGDHWVFTASIADFSCNHADPLVFFRGRYCTIDTDTGG